MQANSLLIGLFQKLSKGSSKGVLREKTSAPSAHPVARCAFTIFGVVGKGVYEIVMAQCKIKQSLHVFFFFLGGGYISSTNAPGNCNKGKATPFFCPLQPFAKKRDCFLHTWPDSSLHTDSGFRAQLPLNSCPMPPHRQVGSNSSGVQPGPPVLPSSGWAFPFSLICSHEIPQRGSACGDAKKLVDRPSGPSVHH